MRSGSAKIISFGENGITASAAASRMSTTEGNALQVFGKSGDREKDLKLIGKVLASGHNTVIEHAYFNIAFNDVSVLTEQLMIEHRLAAYTVKSRRYVNFSGAGYVVPEGLTEEETERFRAHMDGLFAAYNRLTELGVPCEDARFVLPYCFRSNFIMSVNARELGHIINEMTTGRLSGYPEMVYLGTMLKEQADELFPGMVRPEKGCAEPAPCGKINPVPAEAAPDAEIVSAAAEPKKLLSRAAEFAGHGGLSLKEITRLPRPRELETLSYTFEVKDVSLACVTHFTRHRIQSLLVPAPVTALYGNRFVLPATVGGIAEAVTLYKEVFAKNAAAAKEFEGRPEILSYYALAGNTVDLLFTMNARELLHFLRLRTCSRAQWEIRYAARDMLAELCGEFGELFRYYGPSCAVLGYCPEGRLSCGKPVKTEE